jgi:hypothetical protein
VSFVFPHVEPEPLWILGLFGILLLAVEGGYRVGRARATRTTEGAKAHVNVVVAAMLGLLALLLEQIQSQLGPLADSGVPGPARFAGLKAVRYRRDDGQDVRATFVKIDPPVARVERGGARWILPLRPSASGTRYSDGTVTFWEHQGEARLELPGQTVSCRRTPS